MESEIASIQTFERKKSRKTVMMKTAQNSGFNSDLDLPQVEDKVPALNLDKLESALS